jgi:hypothetical protein
MGNRSTQWFTEQSRKVLILSFEDTSQTIIYESLYEETKSFNPHIGFISKKFDFNDHNLSLWVE